MKISKIKKNNNYNLFVLCSIVLITITFMILFFMDRQQQNLFEQKQIEIKGDILEQIGPGQEVRRGAIDAGISQFPDNTQNNSAGQNGIL